MSPVDSTRCLRTRTHDHGNGSGRIYTNHRLRPSGVSLVHHCDGVDRTCRRQRTGESTGRSRAVSSAWKLSHRRITLPSGSRSSAATISTRVCTPGCYPKLAKPTAYVLCQVRLRTLARCSQSTPATASYRVKLGDEPEQEQACHLHLAPINDCPFALTQDDGVLDVSSTFAAYVNEQHPFVDKLLREALDRGIVDGFDGYQSGRPTSCGRPTPCGICWSPATCSTAALRSRPSLQTVASQHVRLIEDSVNNSQANCVDGSVLLGVALATDRHRFVPGDGADALLRRLLSRSRAHDGVCGGDDARGQ